jgi:PKD repeat protein
VNRGGSGTGRSGRRPRIGATLLFVALLALAGPSAAAHRVTDSPIPAAIGLSLTAVPVGGNAPLVVELRATLDPSSESGVFDWAFGDGGTYDGSASGYSQVSHEYTSAGTYTVAVSVTTSDGDGNASITIAVSASTLSAAIVATPTTGIAPLTVQFAAEPSGGSGTFTSFLWRFGDGDNGSGADLAYTYTRAGTFNATVVVTDSSGKNATATVEIVVAPAPASAPSSNGSAAAPAAGYVLPALALLVVAAVGASLYLAVVLRRTARSAGVPTPPEGAAVSPASSAAAGAEGPSSPEQMAAATTAQPGGEDTKSLSERILVHLYWYGRSNIDGVARADASQAGMARRLGVAQNSLSKALRRLVDAGALRVELQHVPGAPRRLKTYALTARGEAVARRIRSDDDRRPKP